MISFTACHLYLLDEDNIKLEASSTKEEVGVIYSVEQARLRSHAAVSNKGILAGAWVPRDNDTEPFIKVCEIRMLITLPCPVPS